MCYVWPGVADISIHLAHDADMLVAVEERELFVPHIIDAATMGCSIRFQAGVRQDDYESLCILVVGRYRHMLFRYKLR